MKIMTFNIQHCRNFISGEIDFPLFAKAISTRGADICGLNEVRGKGPVRDYEDQTNTIGDMLGFNRYFGEAIKVRKSSPYGNALVSRFAFRSVETIKIPDPVFKFERTSYESRCIIKAVVSVDETDICILVTHMGLARSERKNAVRTICSIIDSTDMPVVLMGDFNAEPDDSVFDPIREKLSDTQDKSVNPEVMTYPSDKPSVKIDYIFYRGLQCVSAETITDIYADHLPIIAEFNVCHKG